MAAPNGSTGGTEAEAHRLAERVHRVRAKVISSGVVRNPPAALDAVLTFEDRHSVTLPEAYRAFILEVGDGGEGPPAFGIYRLEDPRTEYNPGRRWDHLPDLGKPFPFTRGWVWEDYDGDILSPEGARAQVDWGSIRIGEDGCGRSWHLIVTGSERGTMWDFTDMGIFPSVPKQDFLTWFEDWLDLGLSDRRSRHGT